MMVTCPYNNAHRMKESRLQIHITKCREDHLNDFHFVCPFNSTHVLPHQEKAYHLLRCPDKAPLDRKLAESMDKNNPFKGRTAVPNYSEPVVVEPSEIWDTDEDFEPRGACAAAAKEPPPCAIVQPKPFSKPASRRQLYQELHQIPMETKSTIKAPVAPPEPRQPKQPSEAARLQNLDKPNAEFQGAGLGRGKSSSSRIAANIFNPELESNSATAAGIGSNNTSMVAESNNWGVARGWANQPVSNGAIPRDSSYSAAISAGINNLSLGRGRACPAAAVSQTGFSEDDFPALGLGRGASKNPQKQTGFWSK